jgi:hypothetical protein
MTVKDTVLHAKDNAVAKLQQSKDGAYRFKDDAVHRYYTAQDPPWTDQRSFRVRPASAKLT